MVPMGWFSANVNGTVTFRSVGVLEFKEPFIEKLEDNEIIRFLEIDVPVYCVDVIGDSWAVDEKKDIEVVEKILKK